MTQEQEEWGELDESQGGFEDYVLTIEKSYFAPDAEYQGGSQTLLQWHGVGEDLPEEWKSRRVMYSVGKGFHSIDAGKTLTRADGGLAKVKANSMYGRMLTWAKQQPDLVEVLKSRGSEREAHIWEGLRFRMVQTTMNFGTGTNEETGEKEPIEITRMFPAEYLGEAVEGSATSTGAPATGESLEQQIRELARNATDSQTFLQKASSTPGVVEDNVLFAKVLDLEGGIWPQERPDDKE